MTFIVVAFFLLGLEKSMAVKPLSLHHAFTLFPLLRHTATLSSHSRRIAACFNSLAPILLPLYVKSRDYFPLIAPTL